MFQISTYYVKIILQFVVFSVTLAELCTIFPIVKEIICNSLECTGTCLNQHIFTIHTNIQKTRCSTKIEGNYRSSLCIVLFTALVYYRFMIVLVRMKDFTVFNKYTTHSPISVSKYQKHTFLGLLFHICFQIVTTIDSREITVLLWGEYITRFDWSL